MSVEKSGFHIYSVGIVAKDKEPVVDKIEVFPIEHLGEHDGDLADSESSSTTVADTAGSLSGVNVDKSVTIEAKWTNMGSNRLTAPDVKKGETVILYRYGGSDRYLWHPLFYETDLRRKESVVYIYGNTDEFTKTLDIENSYFLKVDTVNKLLHLHTSNNDGEAVSYDFKINTKDGLVTFEDSNKNKIELNSPKNHLTITVPNVTVKSTNVVVDASDIKIKAGKTTFSGGAVIMDSTVQFNKTTEFKAKSTVNHNMKTTVGPHGHTHTIV